MFKKYEKITIIFLFQIFILSIIHDKALTFSVCDYTQSGIDSGYINVEGGKLYYEIAGEGEPIILIHDGLIHHEVWDGQFPVFAKNYKVIRYDRRSYGKSPETQSLFSNLEDLNQIFIQLKIEKATLIGMSAGGGLCIDFTLKYPEKVSSLVLVGAVVSGYGYSNHFLTRGGHMNRSEVFSDTKKTIKYFSWEDPYSIYHENIKAKEKCFKLLEANQQNVAPKKDQLRKPPDRPAVKYLSEIKVPTFILVGEFDIPDVHAHSGVIEAGISNSKREIIYKAGHLIPLEQPEVFNAAVLKFLTGAEFINVLNSHGVNAAVRYYQKKREVEPNVQLFEERDMNSTGYRFLQSGKIKEAIELFIINTLAYPKSFNTFDSLGEAYLQDNQKELAVKNYEKSLELNPNNENAKQVLKKLKN